MARRRIRLHSKWCQWRQFSTVSVALGFIQVRQPLGTKLMSTTQSSCLATQIIVSSSSSLRSRLDQSISSFLHSLASTRSSFGSKNLCGSSPLMISSLKKNKSKMQRVVTSSMAKSSTRTSHLSLKLYAATRRAHFSRKSQNAAKRCIWSAFTRIRTRLSLSLALLFVSRLNLLDSLRAHTKWTIKMASWMAYTRTTC